jgi:hypothetical protein
MSSVSVAERGSALEGALEVAPVYFRMVPSLVTLNETENWLPLYNVSPANLATIVWIPTDPAGHGKPTEAFPAPFVAALAKGVADPSAKKETVRPTAGAPWLSMRLAES